MGNISNEFKEEEKKEKDKSPKKNTGQSKKEREIKKNIYRKTKQFIFRLLLFPSQFTDLLHLVNHRQVLDCRHLRHTTVRLALPAGPFLVDSTISLLAVISPDMPRVTSDIPARPALKPVSPRPTKACDRGTRGRWE